MICENCGKMFSVGMVVRLDDAEYPKVLWCKKCIRDMHRIVKEHRRDVLGLYLPLEDDKPPE